MGELRSPLLENVMISSVSFFSFLTHRARILPAIFIILLVSLCSSGRAQEAPSLDQLEETTRHSPEDPSAWYELGNYHYERRNYGPASQAYQKAIDLAPGHIPALFRLGNAYFHQAKLDPAEQVYRRIIRLQDRYAGPHLNLGTIHEVRGGLSDALAEYRRAAELAPDQREPLFGTADVYFRMEMWDKAIELYEKGLATTDPSRQPSPDEQRDIDITRQNLDYARTVRDNGGIVPARRIKESLAAPSRTRGVLLPEMPQTGHSVTLRQILFGTSKHTLESLEGTGRRQLEELVIALRDLEPDTELIIEGHTDRRGADDYNEELSRKRAETILGYLAEQGIDTGRFETKGYGERQPVCRDETEEAWRLNRRVVVRRPDTAATRASSQRAQDAALDIRVYYKDSSGQTRLLGQDQPLPLGAQYRIEIVPDSDTCVYIVRRQGDEFAECLFPSSARSEGNPRSEGTLLALPAPGRFYGTPKTNHSFIIRFYTSPQAIEDLEQVALQAGSAGSVRDVIPIVLAGRPTVRPPAIAAPAPALVISPAILSGLPEPANEIEIRIE
ncbi:tetratricopeptide repeat protein [bacterium]|nr:tetratricopeptide repeat protein [bacterium]